MRYSIAVAIICAALAGELVAQAGRLSSHEWTLFKNKHRKSYESPAEEARRFANFMETKQRVERHNAQSNRSFTLGLNHLADWTQGERAKLNGLRVDENYLTTSQEERMSQNGAYLAELLGGSSEPVPNEFDWRKIPGRVSSVKDQGLHCGSCWAFSTIGLLEGQEIGRVSNAVKLSEQELVDCSKSNYGCNGGWVLSALDDLKSLGGIESGEDYPYTAKDGKCKFNKTEVVMKDAGGVVLAGEDEDQLKETLVKYGPISVALDASSLYEYKSGVYDVSHGCKSEMNGLNHAVLLVGYGTDPKQGDYWTIKNSWGADWGESGYFRIKRGVNMCGIALTPTIAKF